MWIGENVTILPGACIGNGVVIGANSVVRGEIPNNVIIAGVPAKIVKNITMSVCNGKEYSCNIGC
ncbi:hypothetical protein V3C52_16535 [Escherichia coli]|nr:hypothetical protein MUTS16_54070 [Escherichia coli]